MKKDKIIYVMSELIDKYNENWSVIAVFDDIAMREQLMTEYIEMPYGTIEIMAMEEICDSGVEYYYKIKHTEPQHDPDVIEILIESYTLNQV